MTSVIQTSSLGYKQGTSYLLRNIDWTVNIGERWVLFGLNGSGKTTLLSILSGYMANTHGTLELFGQTPNADNILELRNKIGLLSSSITAGSFQSAQTITTPSKLRYLQCSV